VCGWVDSPRVGEQTAVRVERVLAVGRGLETAGFADVGAVSRAVLRTENSAIL
jgi:hypothetical protein